MSEEFTQRVLRQVVGRICQPLGWHAMNSDAADVLSDITKQYILTLGRTTAAYSCHGKEQQLLCECPSVGLHWVLYVDNTVIHLR